MKTTDELIEKKAKEILRFKNKLFILKFISRSRKTVTEECIEFGITRSSYYNWKQKFDNEGPEGLRRKKPISLHHPNKISNEIIEKVIELRTTYKLGAIRITWYLDRYHNIKISESSVTRILKRNGLN